MRRSRRRWPLKRRAEPLASAERFRAKIRAVPAGRVEQGLLADLRQKRLQQPDRRQALQTARQMSPAQADARVLLIARQLPFHPLKEHDAGVLLRELCRAHSSQVAKAKGRDDLRQAAKWCQEQLEVKADLLRLQGKLGLLRPQAAPPKDDPSEAEDGPEFVDCADEDGLASDADAD